MLIILFRVNVLAHFNILQPIPLPLAASGNIEDEEWYHGDITRDVANARLLGNGDYLLRAKPNSATGGADYVLSVCSKIQHHAFIKSVKVKTIYGFFLI